MKFSFLQKRESDVATVVETTWDEFCEAITTPVETDCLPCIGHKCPQKAVTCWSPAEYKNGKRGNKNVVAIHALVYDVDGSTGEAISKVEENIRSEGLAGVIVGTHSFSEENPSVRVIIRVSRPVSVDEYAFVWTHAKEKFEIPGDPAIKETDVNRIFYSPSVPRGTPLVFERIQGEALNVDSVVDIMSSAPKAPKPTPSMAAAFEGTHSIDDLLKIVKNKAEDIYEKLMSEDGIAPQGMQDTTINSVASKLVFLLPDSTSPQAIYEMMRPCLNCTTVDAGDEEWPHEKAKSSILRAKERFADEEATRKYEEGLKKQLMMEASAKTGTESEEVGTGPYTDEQLERWAKEQGCESVEEFSRRWIIHKGNSYYVFVNGKYKSAVGKDDLQNAFQIDLARAPIEVSFMDKQGNMRPLKFSTILNSYGRVARSIEAQLALQKSYYDAKSETFFEAACPRRPIVPQFSQDVQGFLELMGAEVVNWVAAASILDRQCAALYLNIPKDSGKTLLATGLARIWTTGGATQMEAILDGFNARVKTCPLIFADEGLPAVQDKSVFIRKLVGNTTHNLREMYRAAANITGCPRILIAGNNDDIFNTGEELTIQDLEAYAERIVYVEVGTGPREYLTSLVNRGVVLQEWIDKDIIAAHSLWLRENHKFKHGKRYIVEGRLSGFHQHLAINSGIAAHVSEWVSRYIISSMNNRNTNKQSHVRIGSGQVLVSPGAMISKYDWEEHMPSARAPSAAKISKTLGKLSSGTVTIDGVIFFKMNVGIIKHQIQQLALGHTEQALKRIDEPVDEIIQATNAEEKAERVALN